MVLLGHTLATLGKIMIAYTAIAVHFRVRKERRIDKAVFKQMRKEQVIGIIGILLIFLGYILEIPSKL